MGLGPGGISVVTCVVFSTHGTVLEEADLGVMGDLIVCNLVFEERKVVGRSESPETLLVTKCVDLGLEVWDVLDVTVDVEEEGLLSSGDLHTYMTLGSAVNLE